MKIVTTNICYCYDFDFSNSGVVGLKQFMYGYNTFPLLNALWVSLCSCFFSLLASLTSSSIFRVSYSDKETSLVVVEKHHNKSSVSCVYEDQKHIGFYENQEGVEKDDNFEESSLVSFSKRCEFFFDKSMACYVEEPKAFTFRFYDSSAAAADIQEQKKIVSFCDDYSNTSFIDVEKPFMAETKLEKSESGEMFVYEFSVLKELLVHENLVAAEESSFDDDDEFIELNPSLHISDIPFEEENEEDESYMQKEEQFDMGFEEQEGYDLDDDDEEEEDDEFEHSDVIEKLKIELRTARTGGLCTILEESETPLEELKPLKIESKPDQLKDRISEIHKVYKNYAVKMRKLDVIDSQTMHSISK